MYRRGSKCLTKFIKKSCLLAFACYFFYSKMKVLQVVKSSPCTYIRNLQKGILSKYLSAHIQVAGPWIINHLQRTKVYCFPNINENGLQFWQLVPCLKDFHYYILTTSITIFVNLCCCQLPTFSFEPSRSQ